MNCVVRIFSVCGCLLLMWLSSRIVAREKNASIKVNGYLCLIGRRVAKFSHCWYIFVRCAFILWFAGTDRHSECAHLTAVPFRIEWIIVSRCRTSVGKSTNEIHSVGFAKNNSLDEEKKNLAGFFFFEL